MLIARDKALDEGRRDGAALAFDRSTVRRYDADGRLHVEVSNISKCAINPYLGREIPDYRELGLNPEKIYQLFRDPEEMAKAVLTFNNLPLLSRHVPVTSFDHQPDLVIGSTGTDSTFEHPYLRNSLVVWAQDAIEGVESEGQKELSSAYRYRADMTPGTYEGEKYDGVMRDLVGNHVALVKEGRAGPDVVVGDSNQEIFNMTKTILTRKGAFACGAALAFLTPKLAQDAKVDLAPAFAGVTAKNFKDKKPAILAAVTDRTKGKLAQDADLGDLTSLLDALQDVEVEEAVDAEPAAADLPVPGTPDDKSMDAEPLTRIKAFLAGKVSDEDLAKLDELMGAPPAQDGDDNDEDDKEKNLVSKPAMDAAISAAVREATDAANKTQREIRDAERAVRPYIGDLAMAHDSAEAVYRTALSSLGVKIDGIHASALPAILSMQPLPGAKAPQKLTIAADAAAAKSFADMFPGVGRIGRA